MFKTTVITKETITPITTEEEKEISNKTIEKGILSRDNNGKYTKTLIFKDRLLNRASVVYLLDENDKVIIPGTNPIVEVIYKEKSKISKTKLTDEQFDKIKDILGNKALHMENKEIMYHEKYKVPVGMFIAYKYKVGYTTNIRIGWSTYLSDDEYPFNMNRGIIYAVENSKFFPGTIASMIFEDPDGDNSIKALINRAIPKSIARYFPKFILRCMLYYKYEENKEKENLLFPFADYIEIKKDKGNTFLVGKYTDGKDFSTLVSDNNLTGWETVTSKGVTEEEYKNTGIVIRNSGINDFHGFRIDTSNDKTKKE